LHFISLRCTLSHAHRLLCIQLCPNPNWAYIQIVCVGGAAHIKHSQGQFFSKRQSYKTYVHKRSSWLGKTDGRTDRQEKSVGINALFLQPYPLRVHTHQLLYAEWLCNKVFYPSPLQNPACPKHVFFSLQC